MLTAILRTEMKKILIVDDSIEWLKFHIQTIYKAFGDDLFEINTSLSARDAFEKAIKDPYDLIITDLEMERMFDEDYAGCWLVKNLSGRKSLSKTRIMIVSSAHNISDIACEFQIDYIPKGDLIHNPLLLKYKVEELFNINSSN